MLDLKPYHDAVIAADAKLKEVANQINVLFTGEAENGPKQALALQPQLDAAQKVYDEALGLYNSLKASSKPSDVAKNFVPVSTTTADAEAPVAPAGTMKLAEFQNLTPSERLKFAKGGGKLEN